MGSQPNLASRSEGVSIYTCFQTLWGPFPPNLGRKKINFWPLFRDFRTQHRESPELNVALINKNTNVNLQYVRYKLTYFPWPLTQKRLISVCSLWPTVRRPLRCNHHSCDMSSFLLLVVIKLILLVCEQERAAMNNMFVYVKIPQVPLRVSYKVRKTTFTHGLSSCFTGLLDFPNTISVLYVRQGSSERWSVHSRPARAGQLKLLLTLLPSFSWCQLPAA